MKHLVFLSLFSLGLIFSVPQVMADPSPELRVILIDTEAGGFDSSKVFGISPFDGSVYSLNSPGELAAVDDIVALNGDIYVANITKIVRINVDSSGQAEGGLGNNIDIITSDDTFLDILGIAADSNTGKLYVADSDSKIYTVNPSDAPSAGKTSDITQTFEDIFDIIIDDGFLYILDLGAESGDGAIYKVNLFDFTVTPVYSGSTGAESLASAFGIAVKNDEIFVSGSFSFGGGILKINSTHTIAFSDTGELSFPLDITIDQAENDLYVVDDLFVHRFSLANIPSTSLQSITSTTSFISPVGLTALTISGQAPDVELVLEKTVNATSAAPGDGLLYTITATHVEGEDPATSVIIHDTFPPNGVESVEIAPNQLSFTAEVHYANGTVIEKGNCVRVDNDASFVDCTGFGTINKDDFVIVTLEGIIIDGAESPLINFAEVENLGENANATATTTLQSQLSLSKTASPTSVIAGSEFIDYTIRVENKNTADALDVIITDTLPNGVSDLDIIDQPPSDSCEATPGIDETTILQCGPYTIPNTSGSVEIQYRVTVDADAEAGVDSIVNSVEVTCSNCAAIQKSTKTDVIRQSDLSIEKIAEPDSVTAGQGSISYTITIANDGPSVADDVVITDNLPDGVTFVESDSTECVYDSQNHDVICTLTTTLLVDEQRTLTIDVSVNPDASDELINTATITSSSVDDFEENNQESASVTVDADTDVTITKTGPPKAAAGGIIIYNLSVTNSGPSAALGVSVQDVLPTGLTFINHTQPGSLTDPDCPDVSGTIICDFGNIGPGVTQTKSIQAKIALDFTGTITNEAEVFSDRDSDQDNNISSATTTIEPPFCGRPESDFGENIFIGTEGNDNIKGTNNDDLIIGLGGNDKIQGRDGNDCIIGGDGNDIIHGGKGHDTIEGNAGNDKIHGQQGNDTLSGGDGDDKIYGGQGNDVIDAGSGDDRVHANQGNDIVIGGDGNDWLGAGNGNDEVSGGQGNDKIFGRQGNDILNGDDGDDYIHGGQGNDTVNGGNGNDKIFGQQGNDTLNGNDGDDYIHGGQGNDDIDGGDGYDKCNGAQGHNEIDNCEVEDKKMKEDHEEDDDDEGESEDDDNDHDEDDD